MWYLIIFFIGVIGIYSGITGLRKKDKNSIYEHASLLQLIAGILAMAFLLSLFIKK
jgi:hypothetical protein